MIGFIFSLLGIAALSVFMFALGAVCCTLGAYEKLKEQRGEAEAKAWLSMMKRKEN